jgi:signal transduction histidine kinase
MPSQWQDSSLTPDGATASGYFEPEDAENIDLSINRISWRRQALLAAAIIGCLTVFLLARVLANNPHIPAEWRVTPGGELELVDTSLQTLRPFVGAALTGIVTQRRQFIPCDALITSQSIRWILDDATRLQLAQNRRALSEALESQQVTLVFHDGRSVAISPITRGYWALGAMFWIMGGFSMLLFLVGWIVPLLEPKARSLLFAVMAHCQAAQLLISAIVAVPSLAQPPALVGHEALIRTCLDLITCAAIFHAVALWPQRLPGRATAIFIAWLAPLSYGAGAAIDVIPESGWWGQGLLLVYGVSCIALLTWNQQVSPHPFAVVMRRFSAVSVGTLLLLTAGVSLRTHLPPEMLPVVSVAPVIWGVFFASIILLIPFISRSQNVLREFAMLAGVSTVATSVDLLFVAVFSLSQLTSLTLSLFLSLGAYAAIRHWLVGQMIGVRALTTERMFEHLYRMAREVEAHPERAAERMVELLGHVFRPLETIQLTGKASRSRLDGNGGALIVPLPDLMRIPRTHNGVMLRFAERGKRLFTVDDARLADRILEQLMRALTHERAVERGRSEERQRIAQDLHDDIGARLLTLMYKSPTPEMEEYVRHTLQDLKTLTRGLASQNHSLSLSFAEWKTDIAQRLEAARCALHWSVTADKDIELNVVQWSSLTRILRELVNNVISHAKASEVSIICSLQNGAFHITVSDDGVGKDPAKWSQGLGLGGVRKRVKNLGGTVQWSTAAPTGTVCAVHIPRLTD